MSKNPYLKKAHAQHEYTAEQLLELKKCSEDPEYFILKYCYVKHPTKGAIPFALYEYQKKLIQAYHGNVSNVVLSARQTGKSCTASAYLTWFAMFQFEKTVLIASNKNDNAMEMIDRCKFIYERLPNWLKPGLSGDYSKHSIGFDNGSKIISTATSETSGRGMSLSLLFLDEFAHVRESVANAFWTSISPTLATGGKLIICSTPNGDSNLFADLWRGATLGVNGMAANEVRWDEPPDRDQKFRDAETAKIGEIRFRQEYLCEFLSSDPLLIDTVVLANLTNIVKKIKPVGTIGEIAFYKQPQPNTTYLVGMDPATGNGKDSTAIVVFEFPSLEEIAAWRSNTTSSVLAYSILTKLLRVLERTGSTVYFSCEANGVGEGICALYEQDENPPPNSEFISEDGANRTGMTTTGKSKMKACMTFKELVEKGSLHIKSLVLVEELKHFVRRGAGWDHKPGATSDMISAVLIIMRILESVASYDQEAYNILTAGAYSSTLGDDGEWDEDDSAMEFLI